MAADQTEHRFWNHQPVLKPGHLECGPIESKSVASISIEPYPLKGDFEWVTLDLESERDRNDLFHLLSRNYVEDADQRFRFQYSSEFLRWSLTPPGYIKDWHLGVRATVGPRTLVGFISAIPGTIRIYEDIRSMVEINFLCVHKQLRNKTLAPLLIREITRRVNLHDIWQAVYTAGVKLSTPITTTRYWHRPLNPKKLLAIGFIDAPRYSKLSTLQRLYALPEKSMLPFRAMTSEDISSAHRLLNQHLNQFRLAPILSVEEFAYWFLPNENQVRSFVLSREGEVTDLISFYTIATSVLNHSRYQSVVAAYSYYNVATTISHHQLMENGLILAKQFGHDVYNALDIMRNEDEFSKLKFRAGDGNLSYYLYNWNCPQMNPKEIGLVLH